MSDFAWWKETRAAVVAHSYGDLAVFPNENGDITRLALVAPCKPRAAGDGA
jgi:hypothetical protein